MKENGRLKLEDVADIMRQFEGFDEKSYQGVIQDVPISSRVGTFAFLVDYFVGKLPQTRVGSLYCDDNAYVDFILHPDSFTSNMSIHSCHYFNPSELYTEGTVWGVVSRKIAEDNDVELFSFDDGVNYGKTGILSLDQLRSAFIGINSSNKKLQNIIKLEADKLLTTALE